MQKLDDEAAAKFITALSKSVQTLCHGFLDFHNGIEIIGYIHLNVDKGSNLHYVLEEKVCKNEENSTLFISNSFHAQNQKQDFKGKGKDSENVPSGKAVVQRSNSTDSGETGKVSSAISSISSALSRSHEKSRTTSTSSTKETDTSHSRPVSSTAKRKASDDLNSDVRSAKSSHLSSSSSPVSHFLTHSPHEQVRRTSPIDAKPTLSELRNEDTSGTVLPQTANIGGDSVGDIGVNLAGSVLERVDDQSNSDLPDRGDDSDGDLEVTFIKEEYVEGEQSSCQFENSSGQQQHYGRSTHHRASSSENMPDASLYPVSIHPSASATYVPSAQDIAAAAQHYGPSTSSQPQPGTSGVRGHFHGHKRSWHQPRSSPTDLRKLSDTSSTQTTMDLKYAPKTLTAEVTGAAHRKTSAGAANFIGAMQPTFQGPEVVTVPSHTNFLVVTPALPTSEIVGSAQSSSQASNCSTVWVCASGSESVGKPEQQQPCQASQPNMMNAPLCDAAFAEKRPVQRRRMFKSRNSAHNPSQKAQGQYKCMQCQVPPYQHIGSLKRHMKLYHMNQPVFRCQICKAGFMYKDHYVGHMNKHFDRPTFQCTHCPEKFIYKGDMYHHRKKKHSNWMLTPTQEKQGENAVESVQTAETCISGKK